MQEVLNDQRKKDYDLQSGGINIGEALDQPITDNQKSEHEVKSNINLKEVSKI
jgi:hypothetical protein